MVSFRHCATEEASADASGEIRLGGGGRVEGERRPGCHVVHDLHHCAAFVGERELQRLSVLHAAGFLQHVDARGKVTVGFIERGIVGGEAVLRIASHVGSRGGHAAPWLVVHAVAVEAVRKNADPHSGARQAGIGRAQQVAALGEVTLRGHHDAARAPHRGAHRDELRARRRSRDLIHRQPAADVVGVNRGVLQAEADERLLQPLRVAAGDGIDCYQWHGTAGTLNEVSGGAQRVQILERVIGAHAVQVSGQVGERRIELRSTRARPLCGAACAKGHQLRGRRPLCERLFRRRYHRIGRGCREYGEEGEGARAEASGRRQSHSGTLMILLR